MATWTFEGATFHWLRNGETMPIWKRKPRTQVLAFAGTADAEIATSGSEPYTINGPIWIPTPADYALMEAANGGPGTISDGTDNWTAVLALDVDYRAPSAAAAGYSGTATFIRPVANES